MSVAAQYHWPPQTYEGLYLDDADLFGILWWYEGIVKDEKEFKKFKENLKQQNANR